MKAVFDTNVLLAAYLTEGLCARLLLRARRRQFELITCPQILTECRDNLQKLTSPSADALDATIHHLLAITTVIAPSRALIPRVCRDRDDNGILGCAITAHVDYLVTGDKDLLALHAFEGIPIITPRDFEALFAE